MGYRIRRAGVEDVQALQQLFDGSSGEDACLRLATSGDAVVAVSVAGSSAGEGGGEVVGVAGLGPFVTGQAVEAAAYVAVPWRGRGVGRSLLEVVEAIAEEQRLPLRPRPTVLGDAA